MKNTMIEFVKTLRKNLQDPSSADRTYAVAQSRGTLTLEDVATHVSDHASKYDEGDVYAVITQTLKCMRELLLDGYVLNMGKLGSFKVSLKSRGVAESVADEITGEKPVFSASNIVAVNVRWNPGSTFENLISDATFRETISRKKKQDAIKAQNAEYSGENGDEDDGPVVNE